MKVFAMKKIRLVLVVLALLCMYWRGDKISFAKEYKSDYEFAVLNLKELISNTPVLKSQIDKSLKMQDEASFWYNKSTDDFVKFFNEWLVYNPDPGDPQKYIESFDELVDSGAGEILFNDNVFSSWFISFLNARGGYLGTGASAANIDKWMASPDVNISDYIVPKNGFKTFNDFFLRKPKPKARPLDGKNDSSVVVSPADGSVCQIYAEDLGTNFMIKRDVINIRQALNNSPYAQRFIGGPVLDVLLWFTDYHHFHAPVSGRVIEVGEYAGSYNYDFQNVNWYKELAKHKRTCYVIDTEKFGLVAMIPVGFWGVGSIMTEQKVKVGGYIKKGEEIGHFEYGGSSIILIFEPNKVKFSIPIPVRNTGDRGTPIKVRQKIGVAIE